MKEAGIVSGTNVRVKSDYGEATFKCVTGKGPLGMIIVPYGPPTCHLMGRYTDGTGMPTSKGWEVEVTAAAGPVEEPVDAPL
jgi:formylmethanofuran dehydrogenase subunit D